MNPFFVYSAMRTSLVFKLSILIDADAQDLDGETFRVGPDVMYHTAQGFGRSYPHPQRPVPLLSRLTRKGWEAYPPVDEVRKRMMRDLEEVHKLVFSPHALERHRIDWVEDFYPANYRWLDPDTKSLIAFSHTSAKGRWSAMIRKINDEWQEKAPKTKLLGMWFDANIPLGLPCNPFSGSGYYGQGWDSKADWRRRSSKPNIAKVLITTIE